MTRKKTDDSKHDLPRYSGIPTFLRAPYSESIEDLDIALVGIPYDGGVTFRPGARHGPMEMRMQSSLGRKPRITHGPFDSAARITARWEILLSPGTRISLTIRGALLIFQVAMSSPRPAKLPAAFSLRSEIRSWQRHRSPRGE